MTPEKPNIVADLRRLRADIGGYSGPETKPTSATDLVQEQENYEIVSQELATFFSDPKNYGAAATGFITAGVGAVSKL